MPIESNAGALGNPTLVFAKNHRSASVGVNEILSSQVSHPV